jgi:hypothetical protein
MEETNACPRMLHMLKIHGTPYPNTVEAIKKKETNGSKMQKKP